MYSYCNRKTVLPEFSIEYTVGNPEAAKNELLGEAIKDSMEKANVLAVAAGVKLGDIVNIDYSCCEAEPGESASYKIDIEPDDIDMTDTVTVIWNIA